MKYKYVIMSIVVLFGVFLVGRVTAQVGGQGTLDSPGPPASTQSYTLSDIYNRLNSGAAGTQSSFTEPVSGPTAGTMHTLNEIYELVGQRSPVAKTGQTKCYDVTSEQPCPVVGYPRQDGELQKGVVWPNPRFTDNGNGTVTDNLTGLIWLKNANCANAFRTWQQALQDVAQLNTNGTMNGNFCGDFSSGVSHRTDWRLPSVRELASLVHYGFFGPALPNTAGTGPWTAGDPFDNVQSSIYWSSSPYAPNPDYAWGVSLSNGIVINVFKSPGIYVWPVRGGR